MRMNPIGASDMANGGSAAVRITPLTTKQTNKTKEGPVVQVRRYFLDPSCCGGRRARGSWRGGVWIPPAFAAGPGETHAEPETRSPGLRACGPADIRDGVEQRSILHRLPGLRVEPRLDRLPDEVRDHVGG